MKPYGHELVDTQGCTIWSFDQICVRQLVIPSSSSCQWPASVASLLPYQDPKHGDIIVFRYPPDIKVTLVKRVIGVPGDRLRITNGVVYRNGKRLNEPYVYHKYVYDPSLDNFANECCRPVKEERAEEMQPRMLERDIRSGEVVVPAGEYFAMGDNRDNSSDSRYWDLCRGRTSSASPFSFIGRIGRRPKI